MESLAELREDARAAIDELDQLRALLGANPVLDPIFDAVRGCATIALELAEELVAERARMRLRQAESDALSARALATVRAAKGLLDEPTGPPQ